MYTLIYDFISLTTFPQSTVFTTWSWSNPQDAKTQVNSFRTKNVSIIPVAGEAGPQSWPEGHVVSAAI